MTPFLLRRKTRNPVETKNYFSLKQQLTISKNRYEVCLSEIAHTRFHPGRTPHNCSLPQLFMDDITNTEVIDTLLASIEALLPDEPNPIFQAIVGIKAAQISAPGIGAFVGHEESITNEIYGRHLTGEVQVTVKSGTLADLTATSAATTRSLMGMARKELMESGILKLILDEVGSQIRSVSVNETTQVFERDLTFHVLFEFLKQPAEPEGVIQEIPINQSIG